MMKERKHGGASPSRGCHYSLPRPEVDDRLIISNFTREDLTSSKFQWKKLFTEPKKSNVTRSNHSNPTLKHSSANNYGGISATTVTTTDRNYHGGGMFLEKATSIETDRGRIFYTSNHLDDGRALLPRHLNSGEDLGNRIRPHLHKKSATELYKEENNSNDGSDYVLLGSRSKETINVPSYGLRLSSEMITRPFCHDGLSKRSSINFPGDPYDIRSNLHKYVSPNEGGNGDYAYPEGQRIETGQMGKMSEEYYRKMARGGEGYDHRDLLRTSSIDPIVDRIDECSPTEQWKNCRLEDDSSPSEEQLDTYDLRGSGSLNEQDENGSLNEQDESGLLNVQDESGSLNEQDEGVLGYRSAHPEYQDDAYGEQDSVLCRDGDYFETGYASIFDEGDCDFEQRLVAGDSTRPILKRNCRKEKSSSRQNFGSNVSSNGKDTCRTHRQGVANKQWTEADEQHFLLSKKQRLGLSQFRNSGKTSNETSYQSIYNYLPVYSLCKPNESGGRELRNIKKHLGPGPQNLNASHSSANKQKRPVKNRLGPVPQNLNASQSSVNKQKPSVKKRLGPGPQNLNASHSPVNKRKPPVKNRLGPSPENVNVTLPWMKNLMAGKLSKKIQDDPYGALDQEGDSSKVTVTPAKAEPAENSEEFKQLVDTAFLKFVKQLNVNSAQRRRFTDQGKAGSLKCNICGSNSEEFVDTKSLVLHTITSPKAGCRSQHFGFHKALCLLMGWKSAMALNSPWVRETLPDAETLTLKEDLIFWPPIAIIHNSSIGNTNPDERVIVSTEMLEAILKDMGFGEKTKVGCGKAANHSVMVVKFNGTFSGLQEVERLHKFYVETKHGRAEFQ